MIQLTPGQMIANDYQLVRPLGRGGFGVVWAAHHMRLDREVAIKMIHGEAINRVPQIAARFMREVELAKRLEHPNVVRMYDFGTMADGAIFMVMEYVAGFELKQLIIETGALGVQRSLHIVMQTLDALSEAHSLGIIHRDMKPANIMLTAKGLKTDVVKLLDFGIAKALGGIGETELDLTGTGSGYGTPQYMAPELVMGRDIGPFSDLYAVGLILLECLTGQRAVNGNTAHEVALKQVMEEIPIPSHIAETSLGPILRRALAKEPSSRYQNAAQMYEDISHAESVHVAAHTPLNPMASPVTGRVPRVSSHSPADSGLSPITVESLGVLSISAEGRTELSIPAFADDNVSQDSGRAPSGPFLHSGSNPIVAAHSGRIGHHQEVPQERRSHKRIILLAALATGVLVAGAIAFWLLSANLYVGEDAPTASATEASPPPVAQPTPAESVDPSATQIAAAKETLPAEAVPEAIIVTIEANVEAQVLRDGELIGTTPLDIPGSEGALGVMFVLRAEGYSDAPITADLARSRVYFASLQERPKAAVEKKASAASTTRKTRASSAKRSRKESHTRSEKPKEERSFRRIGRTPSSLDVPDL